MRVRVRIIFPYARARANKTLSLVFAQKMLECVAYIGFIAIFAHNIV